MILKDRVITLNNENWLILEENPYYLINDKLECKFISNLATDVKFCTDKNKILYFLKLKYLLREREQSKDVGNLEEVIKISNEIQKMVT